MDAVEESFVGRTYSQKLALSFALLAALTLAVAMLGVYALRHVVQAKDRVLEQNERTVNMSLRLQTLTYRKSAAVRGYLLTGSDSFLEVVRAVAGQSDEIEKMLVKESMSPEGKALAAQADKADTDWDVLLEHMFTMREHNTSQAEINRFMVATAQPKRIELEKMVDRLATIEENEVEQARREATHTALVFRTLTLVGAMIAIVTAGLLGWWLSRLLAGQIGSAVQEIQSSSTELQSTATEQATGAREQSTAMSEITTTMTELLTTSRQIAESAQRVSGFSVETADAAREGDAKVQRAQGTIGQIRNQVDVLVNHMLDLGRKSQQIGRVTELIKDLAEQTNMLAINANIEAAGAGEAGRRFGVVADEIRNLADRMGANARDVRGLVEEVRGAVNTSVMATESGSKAVDVGTRDFEAVTRALEHILGLVQTTTEAAREIELSTKQQSTAVEQVNVAVSAVAQVSREVEASTTQASQTASELTRLSTRLTALVQKPTPESLAERLRIGRRERNHHLASSAREKELVSRFERGRSGNRDKGK